MSPVEQRDLEGEVSSDSLYEKTRAVNTIQSKPSVDSILQREEKKKNQGGQDAMTTPRQSFHTTKEETERPVLCCSGSRQAGRGGSGGAAQPRWLRSAAGTRTVHSG